MNKPVHPPPFMLHKEKKDYERGKKGVCVHIIERQQSIVKFHLQ